MRQRCTYGYVDGLWGDWWDLGLPDDAYDQCRRYEHPEQTWHFPASGTAISKKGKIIYDQRQWERLWRAVEKRETSEDYTLENYIEEYIQICEDLTVLRFLAHNRITAKSSHALIEIEKGQYKGDHRNSIVHALIKRGLIENTEYQTLTPKGKKIVNMLKGWERK